MIKKITLQNFRRYGRLIGYPGKELKSPRRNLFRIVIKENARFGWRIAYLIVRDKLINRLEQHPLSHESFEPVKGQSIIFVTKKKDVRSIEAFYLDRPVIIYKGICHGGARISQEGELKLQGK